MDAPGRDDAAALSREHTDLLLELSVAVHKHAMYPSGHPALASVAAGVLQRTARLFEEREQLAIGVARRQLVIEGTASDPANPVLRRLAEGLHAHQLGAISLLRGLDADELGQALRALATEPEHGGTLGVMASEARPTWPHVRLHPLTFDNLALVAPPEGADSAHPDQSHSAELWLGLAQAALAGDAQPSDRGAIEHDPEAIARAIDARDGAEAYDQVVTGYLLQIAQTLRTASGAEADALRARTSGLIAALQPGTLRRLLRTSRGGSGRHTFVRDAVQGLRGDAVLEVLKATADVNGETISHGLLRMLTKLAAQAERGAQANRAVAEDALRGQVTSLLADWQLADPNPESYSRLLQLLATSPQDGAEPSGSGDTDVSVRLVQMALEVDALGPLATKAVAWQVEHGGIGALVALLDSPPEASDAAVAALRSQLQAPGALARLLADEPVDFSALDHLLPSMTAEEHEPLLDALANSEHRTTRRRLLDRLAQSPLDLSALIVARLGDPRWHVQRNMLVLLERTGRVPADFTAAPWMAHADWRVRHEAVRLEMTLPERREGAVRIALDDVHPRVKAVALLELQRACPSVYLPRVAAIAAETGLPDDTRVLALRVLEQNPHAQALRTLTTLVDGGRTLLGRLKLAPPSPVCVAALRALAGGFAGEATAAPYLKLARASSIDDIRLAVAPPAS